MPGYSFAAGQFRFGLTASYVRTNPKPDLLLPLRSSSGFGDTRLLLQWDPSDNITANPWVPDELGLFISVTAPTGKASQGLGSDAWLAEIGFGAPVFISDRFVLLPSGYFARTYFEESSEFADDEFGGTLGLYWIFGERFWVGYEPTLFYNRVLEQSGTDHRLVVGKLFRSGVGVGMELYDRKRLDLFAERDDSILQLNLYYVFGDGMR